MTNKKILKMTFLAMMVALGVAISPFLRVEGMCPMAHFINITCAVMLGPYYALLCAVLIGVIRMCFLNIPPLALTGAVFGAFLSGVLYRLSKGKLIFAVIGEVIGTGLIGSVISYPIMKWFWTNVAQAPIPDGFTWFFYVPSFICGTLIGGSIAFIFIKQLIKTGLLAKYQNALGSRVYDTPNTVMMDALGICFIGIIAYLAVFVFTKKIIDKSEGIYALLPLITFLVFVFLSAVYYFMNSKKAKAE